MPLLLYINGKRADLDPSEVIAQTKQVNDLNSIQDRQANYTNKFRLQKTANNVRLMDFLTVTGNTSAVPYTKNECSLYSDNGQCFIYKGRAVVTDGGNYYDVVVYDGIIDFYKEIENKALPFVGLEELNHTKTLDAVVATWQPASQLPYRYIVADYNGMKSPNNNTVMADHLVPSANVAYIWHRIFEKFGFTYSGSVFSTQAFKDLWLTFPKGKTVQEGSTVVFQSDNFKFYRSPSNSGNSFYGQFTTAQQEYANHEKKHIYVAESGLYKISLNGGIALVRQWPQNLPGFFRLYLAKNAAGKTASQTLVFKEVMNYPRNQDFDMYITVNLNAGDSVAFVVTNTAGSSLPFHVNANDSWMKVKIEKLDDGMDFEEALADFSIRDFCTEIMHRFGLTMYKDKYDRFDEASGTYKPHYSFLTLQEQLQTAEIVDWSGKFAGKEKEVYVHGSYAQKNWFRYSYNDKESSHYDDHIPIENVNLAEQKDVIKSKIYAPEKQRTRMLATPVNIYKLWEKEMEEDGEGFTYKALDKRYYLMRSKRVVKNVNVISIEPVDFRTSNYVVLESFSKMSFTDVLQEYYAPVGKLLDKSVVVTASMYLDENDICNFDFRKLYYIRQLSNYFMVNKINNYTPGKPVKCDLVRVLYTEAMPERKMLHITKTIVSDQMIAVFYDNNTDTDAITLNVFHAVTGQGYTTYTSANNPTAASPYPGYFKVYLTAAGYTSNEVYVHYPATPAVTQYY